jgi:branched-chain amino acid transport system ATP-binding protein
MLEVSGLAVSYGPTTAVHGLDLTVEASEAVALLGPNGAGKTSTLRAVSQLVRYRGHVRFDGEDIRGSTPEEVARRGLIHVPEGRHVFPTLNVHENLQMGEVAAHHRRSDYTIDNVYDLFPPLAKLRRRPGFTLSGGEQQMVAIGRALVAAPKFLMLDEPSLGLAPIVTATVFGALDQIRRRTAMLVVEQNTQQALRVCRTGHVLVNGSIAMSASAEELSDRQTLLASYLGQTDIVEQR